MADPALADGSTANGPTANGVHTPVTPQTPQPAPSSLALTEYAADPSPPTSTINTQTAGIPEDFLLPTGRPDVSR